MAVTNEFAFFFAVEAFVPGGGPESGRKNYKKCLLADTGTKIYFSRFDMSLDVLNRGLRLAVRSDSNCHRFATISNRTI